MNSECSEHQKNIPALLLGELAEEEKGRLEVHLARCSQCRSEKESYAKTLRQLASVGEEEVPHHFLVYPENRGSNPWGLFRLMPLGWQAALVAAAMLLLVSGVAAISRLQIRSTQDGWAVSFGRADVGLAAIKKDILEAAEKKNQDAIAAWTREVQDLVAHSYDTMSRQQKAQLTEALAQMDSSITGRIMHSEGQTREDARRLVSNLYRVVSQERARDLEAINLRFDSTDATNAIKARQTNEILGTLLQVADLRLR
jgi:gas vesicle protein